MISSIGKYKGLVGQPLILEGDFKVEGGEWVVAKMLSLADRPTAILAANDLMAIGAIKGIKSQGLRIPQDISLIGLDDIFMASIVDPPLTTINLPRYEIGEKSWKLLLRSIQHKEEMGKEEIVNTRLVVRGTTGRSPCNVGLNGANSCGGGDVVRAGYGGSS